MVVLNELLLLLIRNLLGVLELRSLTTDVSVVDCLCLGDHRMLLWL